ncbi:hypothetical protein ARMGADRAFT_356959 [Armillaria gallica]|uniref:Uncharacterized protein n=1 Tax=Armillaria gallica TaxID=47427 RepID=A0A2H3CZL8_ARMGA|nr:hypothetical protein ARMGADRAFT_356959 [Armillaria gallica]
MDHETQAWESMTSCTKIEIPTRRTTTIYPVNLREFFTFFPERPVLSTPTTNVPYHQGLTRYIRSRTQFLTFFSFQARATFECVEKYSDFGECESPAIGASLRYRQLYVPSKPPPDFQVDRHIRGTKSTLLRSPTTWTVHESGLQTVRGDLLIDKGLVKALRR